MSHQGIAAILSFVVPGVGQLYNGDILRGAFWLVVTPGFWLGSGGIVGGACHLASAYTAYSRGKRKVHLKPTGCPARRSAKTIDIIPCRTTA